MTTKNKIKRILFGVIISIILILIGYLMLYGVYVSAPKESLNWLKLNPIWNYLIIGCFSFSNISTGIHGGIRLSKFIGEKE